MTVYVVVSVWDSAVQGYGRPMFVPSIGAAIRSYGDEVNRKSDDNPMHAHPDDYEMRYLAHFDDERGVFFTEGKETGDCLARAKDMKQE